MEVPCGVEESYFSMKVQADDKAVEDESTFRVMKLLTQGKEHLFAKKNIWFKR